MRPPLKYEPARVPILKHKSKHCNVIKKKKRNNNNNTQFKVLRIFILFFIISYINYNAVFPETNKTK